MQTQTLQQEERIKDRSRFFELTGYGPSDILAFNPKTKIFMTRNGGQYRLTEADTISYIDGPPWEAEERW